MYIESNNKCNRKSIEPTIATKYMHVNLFKHVHKKCIDLRQESQSKQDRKKQNKYWKKWGKKIN